MHEWVHKWMKRRNRSSERMIILSKAWRPKGKWGLVTARRSWQNGLLYKADGQLVAVMRPKDQAFCLSVWAKPCQHPGWFWCPQKFMITELPLKVQITAHCTCSKYPTDTRCSSYATPNTQHSLQYLVSMAWPCLGSMLIRRHSLPHLCSSEWVSQPKGSTFTVLSTLSTFPNSSLCWSLCILWSQPKVPFSAKPYLGESAPRRCFLLPHLTWHSLHPLPLPPALCALPDRIRPVVCLLALYPLEDRDLLPTVFLVLKQDSDVISLNKHTS